MKTVTRPGPRRFPRAKRGHYMHVISQERLALLAREKGYGPVRLARYAGHDNHSYLSRMLRGDRKARSVTPKTAFLISEALGVPLELLFEERQVKSADSTGAAA